MTAPANRQSQMTRIPDTMKAIVQDRYGSPEVLRLSDVAVPTPGPDQVLVEVKAASLNIYDMHMTSGKPLMVRPVAGMRRPKAPTPGADVAGVVVSTGDEVDQGMIGKRVFGETGSAFAEFALLKAKNIAVIPDGVGFDVAAATPMAGMTALQGLRDVGGVRPGHRVLINGASGGVGTFAVQIARILGARVTAVVSTGKVEMAGSIGAERVIDYTKDDYTLTEEGYDILFDNVGDRGWSQLSRVLAPGGIVVSATGPKHALVGPMREFIGRKVVSLLGDKRFTWFGAAVSQTDLETLAGWLATGQLQPVIERTYDLTRVPEALSYLAQGHAHGKLVIAGA